MKMLVLLALIVSPAALAQKAGPPIPPKAPVSCQVTHPTELVWQAPDKSTWTGACAGTKPHGYGWYKFDLSKDGYQTSRVEILLELKNGEVANTYYYAKMFTDEQLSFQGFAQLGGYQIEEATCLNSTECSRIADTLKNGIKPPMPPAPPAKEDPKEKEPTVPDFAPPYRSRAEAHEKFFTAIDTVRTHFFKKAYEAGEDTEAFWNAISRFQENFALYAQFICQRNKQELENCEIYQYEAAGRSLHALLNGKKGREMVFSHTHYQTLAVNCDDSSEHAYMECWYRKLDQFANKIAQRHPNGTRFAKEAFGHYADALSILYTNYSGGSYRFERAAFYEQFLFFLHEQANTNWTN
ncbi:hypothetical protein [Bdellovibrio reynosensis]|uniref:Uncharacterized protein n=1 Tax=Bdellovibrio reynosensis TaxID=2835041 RepID=A0ABY4CD64_9BACT|nr:hypothetical protein [Bdellovibrio reynosensis]UOF02900.1 hypothetical protein MNR06_08030 [Bdellovibrio reynosensis]